MAKGLDQLRNEKFGQNHGVRYTLLLGREHSPQLALRQNFRTVCEAEIAQSIREFVLFDLLRFCDVTLLAKQTDLSDTTG